MLTCSTTLADVGIGSMLAGWAGSFYSVASAAAVCWVIIKPELRPLAAVNL